MLAPCEVAVKCVLPVVRAMIAKRMLVEHRLKQLEVANILGVSQSAVSLYGRKIRGRALDLEADEDIVAEIAYIAAMLVKGQLTHRDYIVKLCDVCRLVRSKGLMCKLHKTFDPTVDVDKCELCTMVTSRCV